MNLLIQVVWYIALVKVLYSYKLIWIFKKKKKILLNSASKYNIKVHIR